MGKLLLILLVFLLGSCHSGKNVTVDPGVLSAKTLRGQREASRTILLGLRCRSCHDSRLETAIPGALKIYDLKNKNWDATMTVTQYQGALRRIKGEASLSPHQQEVFKNYVEQKMAEKKVINPKTSQ